MPPASKSRRLPRSPFAPIGGHDPGTGANLVWMIQIELFRSLATDNRTGLEQGFTRMWKDVAVLPLNGQGIQSDWSYHFHGTQILSGAYGQDWSMAIMIFILCIEGTAFELSEEQTSVFARLLTEGHAWMINERFWDWQVQGRAIDRAGDDLGDFKFGLPSDWIRALAELITSNEGLKEDLRSFADRLDSKPTAAPLVGYRHFYTSDYQTHRRAHWTSAIKVHSIRTQPTECIHLENQKGEHLGQGVLNMYTTSPIDYLEIFPLLDWQAINGMTVEHGIPLEPCLRGGFDWIRLPFVGGVSDGQYGLALMDTASHNLTGKRSWHFYDDGNVALASNITVTTPTSAWTTLVSRLVPKGNITVGFFSGQTLTLADGTNYSFPYFSDQSLNVQWVHIGDSRLAYLFERQGPYSTIGAKVSTKTASYSTVGPYNITVTKRTATVWIDHGVAPRSHDYNYIVLPNVAVQSLPAVIRQYDNDGLIHGVPWPTLHRASFVAWTETTSTFSCRSSLFTLNVRVHNASGAYLFNETSTDFSITLSHPKE